MKMIKNIPAEITFYVVLENFSGIFFGPFYSNNSVYFHTFTFGIFLIDIDTILDSIVVFRECFAGEHSDIISLTTDLVLLQCRHRHSCATIILL
jgi:hypothetical protein